MKRQLHLIIDIHYPLERLSAVIQAGVTHVQLRENSLRRQPSLHGDDNLNRCYSLCTFRY